jgi:hypothetical protein
LSVIGEFDAEIYIYVGDPDPQKDQHATLVALAGT